MKLDMLDSIRDFDKLNNDQRKEKMKEILQDSYLSYYIFKYSSTLNEIEINDIINSICNDPRASLNFLSTYYNGISKNIREKVILAISTDSLTIISLLQRHFLTKEEKEFLVNKLYDTATINSLIVYFAGQKINHQDKEELIKIAYEKPTLAEYIYKNPKIFPLTKEQKERIESVVLLKKLF